MEQRTSRILVVEDDVGTEHNLRTNLTMDGFKVETTASGRHAIKLLDRTKVDLMLLDLVLPDMDGIQVCRIIRRRSRLPIIVLTTRDSLADKILGLDSGADDYLVKPFEYLELAARIRACLRRSSAESKQTPLRLGPLVIDQAKRQVRINGRPVNLTPKEFKLLLLLAANAGRVMERQKIRQALWPDGKLYRWSRAIDVHIQHLRAKIEPHPRNPRHIITVPGVGYCLQTPDLP